MKIKNDKIYAFDTEDDSQGNLLYVNIFDGSQHYGSAKPEFFYDFLNAHPGIYWAHNLPYDMANLDLFCFCECVWKGGLVINGQYHNPGKRGISQFRDSFNLSFVSLAEIGDSIGLPKLDKDFEHTTFDVTDKDDIIYCERDTEIVYRFVKKIQKFVGKYDITDLPPTMASTSMKIFRKVFRPIKLEKWTDKPFDEQGRNFRDFYAGGRTEAFFIGQIKCDKKYDKSVYYADVNSLYPTVMQYNFPVKNYYESIKPEENLWLAYAEIEVKKDCHIPPFFKRYNSRLIFPVGKFDIALSSVEYHAGKEYIEKIKFKKVFNFPHTERIFKTYIDEMYNKRKKTKDPFENFFYKRLMNSLYGKFAMKPQGEVSIPLEMYKDFMINAELKNKNFREKFINADNVIFLEETDLDVFQNLIWASFITAYSRAFLFEIIELIMKKGGKPVYCDTDSIYYISDKDLLSDKYSNELGFLKGDSAKSMHIFGAKEYIFNDIDIACKGVPKKLQREYLKGRAVKIKKPIKYKELGRRREITLDSGIKYTQTFKNNKFVFTKIYPDGTVKKIQKIPTNIWIEIEKQKKGYYIKREVLKNGDTVPFCLT